MADRVFRDRRDAGRVLAELLTPYRDRDDVVVLALPRGGVPVGAEVAAALGAPLDVFLVRKLGVPDQEELAMGAIASGGVVVVNDEVVRGFGVPAPVVRRVVEQERRELERRERAYREGRPPLDLRCRTVVIVDDGLATGASMLAAVAALRELGPSRIVVAVPVAPRSSCRSLRGVVDDVVCASAPASFLAVGQYYRDFAQTTDGEVRELLRAAASGGPAQRAGTASSARTDDGGCEGAAAARRRARNRPSSIQATAPASGTLNSSIATGGPNARPGLTRGTMPPWSR
jgi:predicted phosphoribosyltransferase